MVPFFVAVFHKGGSLLTRKCTLQCLLQGTFVKIGRSLAVPRTCQDFPHDDPVLSDGCCYVDARESKQKLGDKDMMTHAVEVGNFGRDSAKSQDANL